MVVAANTEPSFVCSINAEDFMDSEGSNWQATLDINLRSALVGTRLAAQAMTKQKSKGKLFNFTIPALVWQSSDLTMLKKIWEVVLAQVRSRSFLLCTGSILLMASAGGLFPMPIAPVYAASKVRKLTAGVLPSSRWTM